jgi:hypothetical protein
VRTESLPQLTWLAAGFSSDRPRLDLKTGKVGFMGINWHWGSFFPSTSVSPAILIQPTAPQSLIILSSTLHSLDNNIVVK